MNINENSNLKKSNTVEESRRDSSRENMSPYEEITVMKTEIKEEQCDYEVPLDNVDLENIKEECFSSPENNFKEEVAEQNQLNEKPPIATNEIVTVKEKDPIVIPVQEQAETEKGVKSVTSISLSSETRRNTSSVIRRRKTSKTVRKNRADPFDAYFEAKRRYQKLTMKYLEAELTLKKQELEAMREQRILNLELFRLENEKRKLDLEIKRKLE